MYPLPTARSFKRSGFTVIELLVVIVVLAILASVAIPNFGPTIANNRATTAANEILGTLQFARSEAVKLNQTVIVRPSNTCDSTIPISDWENGWVVCRGNTLIRLRQALHSTITVDNPNEIRFSSAGTTQGANLDIEITVSGAASRRCIRVPLSGSARVINGDCS